MGKTEEIRSRYILSALEDHCLNGDAYVTEDILYKRCRDRRRSLSYEVFKADLAEQIRLGFIHPEGSRLYAVRTWRYENSAAQSLSAILRNPTLSPAILPEKLAVNRLALC